MTTGEKIYELRKEARITQEEFAEKLEVSRQAVSKWESDAAYPETDKIIKIAQMFGVTCDYLLTDAARYETNVVDKRNRDFLTMMFSFTIACIAVGLIAALICYYAISDWYCSLVGLGVLVALLLAAFIVWSIGRYKFLSSCNYSEDDKLHLAKRTKIFIYTAILTTFCYLPTVIFCRLTQDVYVGANLYVQAFLKLSFSSFLFAQLTFIPTGIAVAKIISLIHDKLLGKEITNIKLCDAICVAIGAFALSVTYVGTYYGYCLPSSSTQSFYEDYACPGLFISFGVFSLIILANAIVHKIYEKTPIPVFIFQILCAVLLLANIIFFNASFVSYGDLETYLNYLFGALLTIDATLILIFAIRSAMKGKREQLKQLRIYIPTCALALIQLQPLIYDSLGMIWWLALHCVLFVLVNVIKNK